MVKMQCVQSTAKPGHQRPRQHCATCTRCVGGQAHSHSSTLTVDSLKASRIHRSILQGISSSLLSQSAVQAKCGLASHGRSFGIVRCAPDMRRPKFAALQFTQKYSQKQESPMQPKYSTIFKTTLYFFRISTYSYPSGS